MKIIHYIKIILLATSIIFLIRSAKSQGIVEIREYTEDNQYKDLANNLGRFEVDINSYIDIKFLPHNLPNISNKLIYKASRENIKEVVDFLDSFNQEYMQLISDISIIPKRNLTDIQKNDLKNKLEKQAAYITNLTKLVQSAYGMDYYKDLVKSVDRQLHAGEITRSEYPELLFELLTVNLSNYIKEEKRKLETDIKTNLEGSELTLKVWCIHERVNQPPMPIHLDNYDNLSPGSLNLIDKTTFSRTAEENKKLKEDIEQYNRLAKSVNDFKTLKGDLKFTIDNFIDTLKMDVEEVILLLDEMTDYENLINSIFEEIKGSESRQDLEKLKEELEQLVEYFKPIVKLKNDHKKFLAGINEINEPNPLELITILENKVNQKGIELKELKEQFEKTLSQENLEIIDKSFKNTREILKTRIEIFADESKEKIIEFVDNNAEGWIGIISQVEALRSKYAPIIRFATDIVENLQKTKSLIETVEKIGDFVPGSSFSRPISDVPPTKIEIPRTQRSDNDIYTLYIQVSDGIQVIKQYSYAFRIRTYGFYRNWTAGLNFVNHKEQETFVPATSVSYILHFRSTPKYDGTRWKKGKGLLGNLINMGLGINSVVIPDFENNSNIQFGIGGSLTFFNDIIQVGGGINLQKKDNKGYFSLTASLLELIRQ